MSSKGKAITPSDRHLRRNRPSVRNTQHLGFACSPRPSPSPEYFLSLLASSSCLLRRTDKPTNCTSQRDSLIDTESMSDEAEVEFKTPQIPKPSHSISGPVRNQATFISASPSPTLHYLFSASNNSNRKIVMPVGPRLRSAGEEASSPEKRIRYGLKLVEMEDPSSETKVVTP
jgi:hypothetical protein